MTVNFLLRNYPADPLYWKCSIKLSMNSIINFVKFEVIDMRLRFKFLTGNQVDSRNIREINEFKLYQINLFDVPPMGRVSSGASPPHPPPLYLRCVWTKVFLFHHYYATYFCVTSGRRESSARSPPVVEETGLRIVDRRVRERRRAMDFMLLLLVMLLRQEGECFHLRELLRFRAHERTSVSCTRALSLRYIRFKG